MDAKFVGQMQRKIIPGALKSAPAVGVGARGVDPRKIEVDANVGTMDRMGDIVPPAAARLDNYRQSPVVLAQHDPNQPIARCTRIGVEGNAITATIQFPPEGTSEQSDLYLRLVRTGIISAVSIGFLPLKWTPIPGAGLRFTDWELLELSLVSVAAQPAARITQKFHGASRTPRLDAALGRLAEISPLQRRCAQVAALKAENDRAQKRDVERLKREIAELVGER